MKLVIVHYHLRPGGIRRIIELAAPFIVRAKGSAIDHIVLAVGEATDQKWDELFRQRVAQTPVEYFIEPAFNYVSEQKHSPRDIQERIRRALGALLRDATGSNTIVWAQNPGIGRNLILTRELARCCTRQGVPLISHHHDWWFDNRWRRWPEMKQTGFSTLASVAKTVFPAASTIRHFTINHSDLSQLAQGLERRAAWLPNLTVRIPPPGEERLRTARAWLQRKLNNGNAPVWILPCRLLRRKNVAEALLLTRWLRPAAWLVTTGGVSSADEQGYADKLATAAHRHHWRLRLGVLAGNEARKPSVAELLAASEAVMLTSIQEGFGLPYLEAAASNRPLIARSIPNIAPDLDQFGFRFPQCYAEILIATQLFDWQAERRRQDRMFERWRNLLPTAVRSLTGCPALLAAMPEQPIPFSQLTLTAQLEVLAHPARESWKACAPLNPFLEQWRQRAAGARLRVTPWPTTANRWLSGVAYARRFFDALNLPARRSQPFDPLELQGRFIASKLTAANLFPLLWSIRI